MQELSLKSGGGRNFGRGRNLGRVRYMYSTFLDYGGHTVQGNDMLMESLPTQDMQRTTFPSEQQISIKQGEHNDTSNEESFIHVYMCAHACTLLYIQSLLSCP